MINKILFVCLFFSVQTGYGQTYDSMVNDFTKYAGAVYNEPNGYSEIVVERKTYNPTSRSRTVVMVGLINNDEDILIGLTFLPYHKSRSSTRKLKLKMYNAYHPNERKTLEGFDPGNNWESEKRFIDTLQGEFVSLGKYYEKKSNTDTVVVYPMKITKPFLDKYTNCKYVIAHKYDRGTARVYYFYTDDVDPKEIDQEIKKTWGFVRFKEKE